MRALLAHHAVRRHYTAWPSPELPSSSPTPSEEAPTATVSLPGPTPPAESEQLRQWQEVALPHLSDIQLRQRRKKSTDAAR